MKSFYSVVVAGIVATSLSGCYSLTYTGGYQPDGSQVTMTRKPDAKVLHRFHAEDHGIWLALGLLPLHTPNAEEIIRREAIGKDVQGLSIHSEQSFLDGTLTIGASFVGSLLVSALTAQAAVSGTPNLYLYSVAVALLTPYFRSVTVEGDIVDKTSTTVSPAP